MPFQQNQYSAVDAEFSLCAGTCKERQRPVSGRDVQIQVLYSFVCGAF